MLLVSTGLQAANGSVGNTPIESEKSVRGLVVASRTATLSSQMNGRINRIYYRVGESFRKGVPIVSFDCDKYQAEQAMAKARFSKAQMKYESQQELFRLEAISELELNTAKAEAEEARASLKLAESAVKDCSIKAPYAGAIVDVLAHEYENVGYGTPLVKIVEKGKVSLELLVPSLWLAWLQPDHELSIYIDEKQKSFSGRVASIGAMVDSVSQTVKVLATIDDPGNELLPGMSGTATFNDISMKQE